MKFNIPDISYTFKLTEDYLLQLKPEYRNRDVIRSVPTNAKRMDDAWEVHKMTWQEREAMIYNVMLPAGTVLSVARVYIRKGASDFSSLTFNIKKTPAKHLSLKSEGGTWKGKRSFWISLEQAHEMEFEPV